MTYTCIRSVDALQEPVTSRELMTHLRLDDSNVEPVPSAPTVALASPATPGNVPVGTHRYRLTFVTADGETDGGQISSAVAVVDEGVNGQVELTDLPIGGATVTARRVYRTKVGDPNNFFLALIINDNTSTSITDNIPEELLGAGCPTVNSTLDPELFRLIRAARIAVENHTRRALIQQTWQQRMREFPATGKPILLRKPNLLSVNNIVYVDPSGFTQTLYADTYDVETEELPGKVWHRPSSPWPATQSAHPANVLIEFMAGYGASRSAVPDGIRQAILIHAADLYMHRESFVVGTSAGDMKFTARNLLEPYIWREVW